MLLYPAAIAYATVRYRLFDATVVIRRSVVYTALAGLITGAYALMIAAANAVLAQADLGRSPWFSGAFMFAVVLAFNPLRERVRRAVDRTFFRERSDAARTMQALARGCGACSISTRSRGGSPPRSNRRCTCAGRASCSGRRRRGRGGARRGAGRAVPLPGRRRSAFRRAGAGGAGGVGGAPRRGGGAAPLPGRAARAPRARSEALGGAYTAEDLDLLEALADQAAVALANAESHRQVLDYARQLERSLLIRTNLAKFVAPARARADRGVAGAPSLDKRETDVSVLFADITG